MNGENAAPLYKFLKLGKWGIIGDDIQWNFAKFLVDKNGQAVDRYYPTTSPLTIEVKTNSSIDLIPNILHGYAFFFFFLIRKDMLSCYFFRITPMTYIEKLDDVALSLFGILLQRDIQKLLGIL